MKIALSADIHGNLTALDAALDAIARERPDRIICLGSMASTRRPPATGPCATPRSKRSGALGR